MVHQNQVGEIIVQKFTGLDRLLTLYHVRTKRHQVKLALKWKKTTHRLTTHILTTSFHCNKIIMMAFCKLELLQALLHGQF